jgi:hypothetical protein
MQQCLTQPTWANTRRFLASRKLLGSPFGLLLFSLTSSPQKPKPWRSCIRQRKPGWPNRVRSCHSFEHLPVCQPIPNLCVAPLAAIGPVSSNPSGGNATAIVGFVVAGVLYYVLSKLLQEHQQITICERPRQWNSKWVKSWKRTKTNLK